MKIICDRCGKELQQQGSLLFTPPNEKSETTKYHFCIECYVVVMGLIFTEPSPRPEIVKADTAKPKEEEKSCQDVCSEKDKSVAEDMICKLIDYLIEKEKEAK